MKQLLLFGFGLPGVSVSCPLRSNAQTHQSPSDWNLRLGFTDEAQWTHLVFICGRSQLQELLVGGVSFEGLVAPAHGLGKSTHLYTTLRSWPASHRTFQKGHQFVLRTSGGTSSRHWPLIEAFRWSGLIFFAAAASLNEERMLPGRHTRMKPHTGRQLWQSL